MFLFLVLTQCFENDNPLRMWYTKSSNEMPIWTRRPKNVSTPSNEDYNIWSQNTIPIGNGFIGANIFGEIKNELLTFNELTLREGGPSIKRPNYNGGNNIERGRNGTTFREIQQMFDDHQDWDAGGKCGELTGDEDGYGTYLEFGEIYIDFDIDESDTSDYVRWLDLDTAISYVQFKHKDTILSREYFVSHPDNALVIHFNATNGVIPTFSIHFETRVSCSSISMVALDSTIDIFGRLEDNQMMMAMKIIGSTATGHVEAKDGTLTITGSNDIYFYVTAATDYKNVYPNYRTGETARELQSRLNRMKNKGMKKGLHSIRENHIQDYQNLFNRVSLDLGNKPSKYPTNEQLAHYKQGSGDPDQDRDLEVLLFQYGRYLLISSSREDGILPANLQGLWNDRNDVRWAADYHININLQMNYWPAFVTNLHETALPLIDYVEGLRIPGRITAEIYTGVKSNSSNPENGFMAHTQTTPFGWTCPGWDFSWGWSPAAVPWLLQNIYDYYLFTKDKGILRDRIYPMMKEECVFFDQIMVYNEDYKRLVTSPTYSPEHGPRTPGNAYEQTLLWQHYYNTIQAAQILNVDSDLIPKWNETLNQLKPIEIGETGQIKEWYNETYLGSMGERQHRHISHLLGLYPGDLINVDTKDYLNAAIVSLNDRGDYSTGWSMGQRINAWSRTGDGNRAHQLLHNLFTNGIFNNLWDYHQPDTFQIDGNFGATSGMAEMLLQSNRGYIDILPSLPDVWSNGKFEGFVARGNVEVDVTWENGKATEVKLRTPLKTDLIVQCKGITSATVINNVGGKVEYSVIGDNKIIFSGVAGEIYTISNFKNSPKYRKNRAKIVQII